MAVIAAYLRRAGITIFPYLDDYLLSAPSREQAEMAVATTKGIFETLGLIINLPKSTLIPAQSIVFIGARLDSTTAMAYLPTDRADTIRDLSKVLLTAPKVPYLTCLKLLGHMASTTYVIAHARLRMRCLQHWLLIAYKPGITNINTFTTVPARVKKLLVWWTLPANTLAGVPFRVQPPSIQLTTDASLIGWGAHMLHYRTQGLWSHQESLLHINFLELRAVFNACRHFVHQIQGTTIQVLTDNICTVYYINRQGGARSRTLCAEAVRLWNWAIRHRIALIASYLPGKTNIIADTLSRSFHSQHEWELLHSVARDLFRTWGYPEIDLFATRDNRKCRSYSTQLVLRKLRSLFRGNFRITYFEIRCPHRGAAVLEAQHQFGLVGPAGHREVGRPAVAPKPPHAEGHLFGAVSLACPHPPETQHLPAAHHPPGEADHNGPLEARHPRQLPAARAINSILLWRVNHLGDLKPIVAGFAALEPYIGSTSRSKYQNVEWPSILIGRVLQVLVDHHGHFTEVFVRWSGRARAARVFRNSSICGKLEMGTFFHCRELALGDMQMPLCIMGDAAYPFMPMLMEPSTGHLEPSRDQFNARLNWARIEVECAFSRLKAHFRCLLTHLDVGGGTTSVRWSRHVVSSTTLWRERGRPSSQAEGQMPAARGEPSSSRGQLQSNRPIRPGCASGRP
ncbi:uncharacterized protein LOC142829500 [Pelodiscus sinensis]|uniref:uncharacterized protein LOC142829500 n=1 Tax=Pelodiscus sinensis TaxID=13735 RepID=UPI003F6B85FD